MKAIVTDADVLGGDPRLDGMRIGVAHVYRRYENGEAPEAIAAGYDGVSVADIHAAFVYAFDNLETLREIERSGHNAVEHIREKRPVDPEEPAEQA